MHTVERSKTEQITGTPEMKVGDGKVGRVPAIDTVTGARHRRVSGARGHVVEDMTGVALAGVVVRWVSYGAKPSRRTNPVELCRALTAADGSFTITPARNNVAREAL